MILRRVSLRGFRNIHSKVIDVSPVLTVLLGENAQGKTNILESIHVGINGFGFRESKEDELITLGEQTAQIDLLLADMVKDRQFRILIAKDATGKAGKKYYVEAVNKTGRQYRELSTRTVLFSPEQIDIVIGSPDIRRSYMNMVISSHDESYTKHVTNYEQALRKRNKILEHAISSDTLNNELLFWDAYLVKEAAYITTAREHYVAYINSHPSVDAHQFSAEYIKDEFTLDRLAEKKNLELKIRKTLIGPQKDNFVFSMKGKHGPAKNIHKYGSRSEQRMTVFWLKLNELFYCEDRLKITPLLLLDDVFSEFDHDNKERILKLIRKYQTVLTTTENERITELQRQHSTTTVIPL